MANFYTHRNLIILKNGSSIKMKNLQKVDSFKVFFDNYNMKYLSKVQKTSNVESSLKKLIVNSFFDKYHIKNS